MTCMYVLHNYKFNLIVTAIQSQFFIGASLIMSEPHTNHCYEKIAVFVCVYMYYVYTYVAIRCPYAYSACAYV